MAKEFVYNKKKEIGKIGEHSVEVGYYTVDGKDMTDKVYVVSHFTRKNGEEDSKATAICSVEDAQSLGKMLIDL